MYEKDQEKNGKRFFERRPNFEFKADLSKDGKYWILKNITTWIIPNTYFDAIIDSKTKPKEEQCQKS